MDDTDIERIKNNISNDLSNINTNEFISKLKNSSSVLDCISISNEFIETFNEMKSKLILNISNELNQIKNAFEEKEISNNILQNEMLISYSNIKNIINQNKLKTKNISSNINDIFTSVNLINSNLEKKKYSLASSRVSKIISMKNITLSNIKLLESNYQKILEEIVQDKTKKLNTSSSNSTIKVRPAPTPFPVTNDFNLNNKLDNNNYYNKKKISINNKNNNIENSSKKKIINKRKRDFSFSLRENTIDNERNISVNNSLLRGYSTINNFYHRNNGNKNEDELNKKIMNLKKINENLKKEIEKLKEKINKFDFINEQTMNNSTQNINIMIQNINIFKEKINSVSDMLFSLTFLFNKLQNNYKSNSEDEKAFSDIKKNLLEITTEISELKSILLKISLENDDNPNQITLSSSTALIKSTNQSINFTEDLYTLTENKEAITQQKSDNNNIKEISSLKEKLRISEKKLIELKSIYESDIESRNLIEKLLKQNLEENKISYEQKISKYKKKYEEKEKEMNEIRKKIEEEEMNILNKIKNDNEENIQKLKTIYELKINNNKINNNKKNPFINLSEEKSINLIIINSNMNENNSSFEKEEYEKKIDSIEKEKKNLEIQIEKEKFEHRENNNKNLNKILQLENDILTYKNKQNELNEEIISIMHENEKKIKISEQETKTYQNKIETLTKTLNEYNEEIKKLKNEKEKIENDLKEINNKLNKKDKEIITLITNNTKEKKNLIEQNKFEIDKIKKENNEYLILNNNYKSQITQLQQKISSIENTLLLKTQNISINKVYEFNLKSKNNSRNKKDLIEIKEISLIFLPSIMVSKKKSNKNILNNNSMEESNEEEESEDFYEYENEPNDDFIKKLKKLNKKNKTDNEEMKLYRKENRKLIYKLEDTLDEVDELKEKMDKIEKLVAEKQGQLYNSLKKYFGRILVDFNLNLNLNNENSDNFIYFMKLIQFSDEEIKNIISSISSQNANNTNTKKKIQFNFFK